MATMGIVPSFDELKHGLTSLLAGAEGVAIQELALQSGEEALAEGIVVATPAPRLRLGAGAGVSDRAHRGSYTSFTAPFTEGQGGVVAALVTDIGCALGNLEKQVLQERRAEVETERQQVTKQMQRIEERLRQP